MNGDTETVRARRYLLGAATEDESAAIEERFFEDDGAVDRVAAAEDDLIEEYLANQLSASDRARFEEHYLQVPRHRVRVETIRRLLADAASRTSIERTAVVRTAPKRVIRYGPWLALAASLLVVVSVSLWMASRFGRRQSSTVATGAPSGAPAVTPGVVPHASAPRAFALTLSPVAVRGAADAPTAVVPAGTEIVAIRLERDADGPQLAASRAVIRTVTGGQVWAGPVTIDQSAPGAASRIDVPAASLPVDDYLVTLFGTDARGAEREWTQYFLRVRAR
jgi:hypothetical protein